MASQPPRTVRVAIFSDGRPGHEKQSQGIVDALADLVAVEVRQVKVRRTGALRSIADILVYLLGISAAVDIDQGIDLLIGAGRACHLPMLHAKKKIGAPVVVCMAPPVYLRGAFDICFVPEHDQISDGGNIIRTIGAPTRSRNYRRHGDHLALVAVGGPDPRRHDWDNASMLAMVGEVVAAHPELRWTITTSPRTPKSLEAPLAALARSMGNVRFVPFTATVPGWIEEQYNLARTVWVSADSVSMVCEALSAGCGVGLLPVTWRGGNNKFARNEKALIAKGYVTSFADWQRGRAVNNTLTAPINESRRCAEIIYSTWFNND